MKLVQSTVSKKLKKSMVLLTILKVLSKNSNIMKICSSSQKDNQMDAKRLLKMFRQKLDG